MRANYIYCDICDCPVKGEACILDMYTEKELINSLRDEGLPEPKFVREICMDCRKLIEDIFKLKKSKIKQITDRIEKTYQLKSKQPKRNKKLKRKK